MTDKINLDVVTPERRVLELEADEVVLPSTEGSMGVLPGHAPLLAMLDVGELSYRVGKQRHYLTVSGGFAEILRGSVTVLARTCEQADEIDVPRAERARDEARNRLNPGLSEGDFSRWETRLKRAVSRIQVHDRVQG